MLLKIPNFDSYDQNEAYGSIKIYPKEDQKNIIILFSFLFFFFQWKLRNDPPYKQKSYKHIIA